MKVLITGGAGYIGSTIASACADRGHEPVVLDDLSTGRAEFVADYPFYRGDVSDHSVLERIIQDHSDISVVIHCAAKIVVSESMERPLEYFEANVGKTIDLLRNLDGAGISRLVFSSSASVYAPTDDLKVTERSPVHPTSPYAATKLMVERILAATARSDGLGVLALRYFNPVGADPRLRSGQQAPKPTHLMGRLLSGFGRSEAITINGTDWPTRDGSTIRDFIHVWDLANAHVAAIEKIEEITSADPFVIINVGTGSGTTVRELINVFIRITGASLDVREGPRRPGDSVGAYADTTLAAELLGWRAELTEEDSVRDSVRWLEERKSRLGY